MVREAGDQLAVVELSLAAQFAFVQALVVLRLLRDDVEHQAEPVHVREDDLPLVQLAAIEAEPLLGLGPGPDVLAVAAVDVVGEEVDAVHALGGQVVQGPDDALALAVLPGGVAGPPVLDVRLVVVDELRRLRLRLRA